MKYSKVYKRILEECGYETQASMCIEEMSELTKALCKLKRYGGEKQKTDVIEEIADVLNMVEQLKYFFGCDDVEAVRAQKIGRFLKRLDESDGN